jgi:anti-sigma factor RsiW
MKRMTMHCDDAIERLPWLLNGTLEPAERGQVEAHLAGCPACRQALAETRLAWEVFDQHLPAEMLLALAGEDRAVAPSPLAGEGRGEGASDSDRALAERHLAECPRCAAELEMVRASRALLENEEVAVLARPAARQNAVPVRAWRSAALAAGLAGVVAATGWYGASREVRSLEDRVAAASPAPAPAAPAGAGGAGGAGGDRAAALEQENARLRAANAELDRQRAEAAEQRTRITALEQAAAAASAPAAALNSPIVDVYANTTVRGEGGEPATVPPGGTLVQLILHPQSATAAEEIELADAAGRVRWQGKGLARDTEDVYTVALPRQLLSPAGVYTLTLYDTAGGTRTKVESFELTVR